ncbi:MAG: hypothetical protein J6M18_02045 [Actinomycetaceae bacterium]|nr:hypothetical protein [Actinomycetaceae bacterium]
MHILFFSISVLLAAFVFFYLINERNKGVVSDDIGFSFRQVSLLMVVTFFEGQYPIIQGDMSYLSIIVFMAVSSALGVVMAIIARLVRDR